MRTHTKKSPPRYRVRVVESDVQSPRRHPDRPRLTVDLTITVVAPHERRDLAPRRTFPDRASAKKEMVRVNNRLKARGFTVNGDLEIFRVYVIELDPAKAPRHRGYLYVGQTNLEPSQRVEQHRSGYRNDGRARYSRPAHNHFVRRRPDLEPRTIYFEREAAMLAESRTRRRFEAKGWKVIGGTERLDQV